MLNSITLINVHTLFSAPIKLTFSKGKIKENEPGSGAFNPSTREA